MTRLKFSRFFKIINIFCLNKYINWNALVFLKPSCGPPEKIFNITHTTQIFALFINKKLIQLLKETKLFVYFFFKFWMKSYKVCLKFSEFLCFLYLLLKINTSTLNLNLFHKQLLARLTLTTFFIINFTFTATFSDCYLNKFKRF